MYCTYGCQHTPADISLPSAVVKY